VHIGHYSINLDALLARIIYRWRVQMILIVLLCATCIGLWSGRIPPFWRGHASLTLRAAPGATLLVDDRAWPHGEGQLTIPTYAGQHRVVALQADGRSAWADITLRAGETLTLTLPAGLAEPRERELPPAAPGAQIDQIWWADGAWRVSSVQGPRPTPAPGQGATLATPAPIARQTVAVGAQATERLPTLDAYLGLADQLHIGDRLLEAVYQPAPASFGSPETSSILVRGWAATEQVITTTAPLTMVRFAPDGSALLMAEQVPTGGEQVYLAQPRIGRIPIVAVPGHVARISWRPDGSAVALSSVQDGRLTLTLVRLRGSVLAAAIADIDAHLTAAALLPSTWDADGLLWIAPDGAGVSTLWRAPLATLIPERRGALDARAISRLADATLRAVTIHDGAVVIGRYQGDVFIGESVLSRVPPAPELVGMWQDDELLLQSNSGAWLLNVAHETKE
jgi:hypothetical protein